MTDSEMDALLKENLRKAGVQTVVDWAKYFLFPTPEGVLAEIVLTDASKLEEAEMAIDKARRELERQGIALLPTVRAVWQVESVEPQFRSEEIERRITEGFFGLPFVATLRSGSREQKVGVELMPGAYGGLELAGRSVDDLIKVVTEQLKGWLSVGGAGYWDPIREPRRIVGGGQISYILSPL